MCVKITTLNKKKWQEVSNRTAIGIIHKMETYLFYGLYYLLRFFGDNAHQKIYNSNVTKNLKIISNNNFLRRKSVTQ